MNIINLSVIDKVFDKLDREPLTCERIDLLSYKIAQVAIKENAEDFLEPLMQYLKEMKLTLLTYEGKFNFFPWDLKKSTFLKTYFFPQAAPITVELAKNPQSTVLSFQMAGENVVLKIIHPFVKMLAPRYVEFSKKNTHLQEKKLLSLLAHPNIVPIYPTLDEFSILMPKLEKTFNFEEKIPLSLIRIISKDFFTGLSYLHSKKIVHSDLHEMNLGIYQGRGVLFDFGSAVFFGETPNSTHEHYLAPEKKFLKHYLADSKEDIWSLAIALIQLYLGKTFETHEILSFGEKTFLTFLSENYIPGKFADLLYHCFARNPKDRITATDALIHPFLTDESPARNLIFIQEMFLQKYFSFMPKMKKLMESVDIDQQNILTAHFLNGNYFKLLECFKEKQQFWIGDLFLNGKHYVFLLDETTAKSLEELLFHELDESRASLEMISNLKTTILDSSFWDQDPKNVWMKDCKKFYQSKAYPMCLDYLKRHQEIKTQNVIELCGGNGEFASLFFDQQKEMIHSYSLIDLNKSSIDSAKRRFSGNPILHVIEGDITNEEPYLRAIDHAAFLTEQTEVDLVLAIGGLTFQVLPSKESALLALSHAYAVLRKGGHVLLTGLAQSWIDSDDLIKIGFSVMETFAFLRPFYVARKE